MQHPPLVSEATIQMKRDLQLQLEEKLPKKWFQHFRTTSREILDYAMLSIASKTNEVDWKIVNEFISQLEQKEEIYRVELYIFRFLDIPLIF